MKFATKRRSWTTCLPSSANGESEGNALELFWYECAKAANIILKECAPTGARCATHPFFGPIVTWGLLI